MIFCLIGHRGSGKSAFLERLKGYFEEAGRGALRIVDLDRRVADLAGMSVDRIFSTEGEDSFRARERRALDSAIEEFASAKEDVVIALGAGFTGELPPSVRTLWIRRKTDSIGRIFIDRPRLNSMISAWSEYHERFLIREARYCGWADAEWTLGEGFADPNPMERDFVRSFFGLSGELPILSGAISLLSGSALATAERLSIWPGLRFEIRDDLLSDEESLAVCARIPRDRLLWSFRRVIPSRAEWERAESRASWIDWPMELGAIPDGCRPTVLSLHERASDESVSAAAERLTRAGSDVAILKLAVEARDWSELAQGHTWTSKDPGNRTFLPRSAPGDLAGRWAWYREWMMPSAPLHFIREGEGTSPDQPTFFEVLRARSVRRAPDAGFAAILGYPVVQSRTPAEQFRFFAERGMPVLSIPIREEEWESAIPVLESLGLRAAAVTAPLKKKAFELAREKVAMDDEIEAINTLMRVGDRWIGTNTDLMGFEALFGPMNRSGSVAVWGGGGTLDVVQKILPEAVLYSVRTGRPRAEGPRANRDDRFDGVHDGLGDSGFSPDTVIWAVGRSRQEEMQWPPRDWKPSTVVDLNYTEDSPGREYSLLCGAKYVSGWAMFAAQAEGQRRFWSELEKRRG